MYLDNLVKIANKLDDNKDFESASKVDEIIYNISLRVQANNRWKKVVTASTQKKLDLIYAQTLFQGAIKLSQLSEQIKDVEVKSELNKISEKYIKLVKESGFWDFVGDIGRGIWKTITSPLSGYRNQGTFIRNLKRAKDMVATIRNSLSSAKNLQDENEVNGILSKLEDYIQQEKLYYDGVASDAILNGDEFNHNLATAIGLSIDAYGNRIQSGHNHLQTMIDLNKTLISIVTGRQREVINQSAISPNQANAASTLHSAFPSKNNAGAAQMGQNETGSLNGGYNSQITGDKMVQDGLDLQRRNINPFSGY